MEAASPLAALLARSWAAEPDERPSFNEIADELKQWLDGAAAAAEEGDVDPLIASLGKGRGDATGCCVVS